MSDWGVAKEAPLSGAAARRQRCAAAHPGRRPPPHPLHAHRAPSVKVAQGVDSPGSHRTPNAGLPGPCPWPTARRGGHRPSPSRTSRPETCVFLQVGESAESARVACGMVMTGSGHPGSAVHAAAARETEACAPLHPRRGAGDERRAARRSGRRRRGAAASTCSLLTTHTSIQRTG